MALQENFPDLAQLYGQGPLSGFLGGQQLDRARRSQDINQQGALQEMYHKEQQLPVDLDYKKALTGQTQETTRGLGFKNTMNERTQEEQYKAQISKLMAEMSDNDIKESENAIRQLMLSPAAHERQVGEMLFQNFSEVAKQRANQAGMMDRQLELEDKRGENARATAAAKAAGTASKPMNMQQYEAMLRQRVQEDPSDAIARQALVQLEADKRARAAAGGLVTDKRVRELLGMDGDANDRSSTGTGGQDPNQRVRVKGPDGRTGTIPRGQLQEALKNGFTEVK